MTSESVAADDWIVDESGYSTAAISQIGGKAKGLGAILDQSLRCPASFCITTSALQINLLAGDPSRRRQNQADPILPRELPAELAIAIKNRAAALPKGTDGGLALAVRSSFVSEDTAGALSPGIYRSEVGITALDDLCAAIIRVWTSAFTEQACAYRRAKGLLPNEFGMAVIVQNAPTPVAGGVAHTILPGTHDATAVLIEYADGSPANVIENRSQVHSRVVSKHSRTIAPIEDNPFLARRADELITGLLKLERAQNGPLDVEWLIDERGELFLLQARRLPFAAGSTSTGPFVSPARATTLRSPKLMPFRLAGTADIRTILATLILPTAYAAFKQNGWQIPPDLAAECRSAFDPYLRRSPVSIRSAYWSALDRGDLMPQSGRLTSADECLAHVARFWRFIHDNGRDDYTAEVALLVCNWTDLRASVIATVLGTADSATATVAALYGQLDGLEACAHDVYEINLENGTMLRQVVPDKRHAIAMPGQPPQEVPPRLRQMPVLDAEELRGVAYNLAAIRGTFGRARVELLVLNGQAPAQERVVTWQVSSLEATQARLSYFRVTSIEPGASAELSGTLIPVRGPEDGLALIAGPADKLAYVDITGSGSRDLALANELALALKQAGCPVLLRGSLLSHFAMLLRDYGIMVYPIIQSVPDGLTLTRVAVIRLS